MKKIGIAIGLILALTGAVALVSMVMAPPETATEVVRDDSGKKSGKRKIPTAAVSNVRKASKPASNVTMAETEDESASMTDEEKREAEAEKLVDTFDNLTDKWMEPSENGVKLSDVGAFVAQFNKVPSDRKEECLQRALNLIPDENVMLLAGILMDKSQPKELVELVFNDILNRDENIKKPIMAEIYKDRTHPCWTDTAWIFDVTGEK